MEKVIGVSELQRKFQDIFEDVAHGQAAYVLTRDNGPEAALIPYADYLRFRALQEQRVLAQFDQLRARLAERNQAVGEEELAAEIEAARTELSS